MSIHGLINRPCEIVVRGQGTVTDDDGNEVPVITRHATFCEAQPRRAVEPANQGDLSDEDWAAFFLPADGAHLNSASAVEIPGLGRFEVEGRPPEWRNPRTAFPVYVQANLRRTAGPDELVAS